jgi:putative methyltransferase (TIGR04325 family)
MPILISQKLKSLIKGLIPPVLLNAYKSKKQIKYGFFGDYQSWNDACRDSAGYNSDVILNKVKNSLLLVKEGKAIYERDSVLFDKIDYSFPVLAGLLRASVENDGRLSVLDFGGSLGSSYYQNRKFLSDLRELKWSIVEQSNFVRCGKSLFEDENLKFYDSIDSCLQIEKSNVLLLSSVLQYLENPYAFLSEVFKYKFEYIIVDVTAFFQEKLNLDRLTVQKVPPHIYEASYPAWIFNLDKFINFFLREYEILADFDSLKSPDLERLAAELKGFIFKRKN